MKTALKAPVKVKLDGMFQGEGGIPLMIYILGIHMAPNWFFFRI